VLGLFGVVAAGANFKKFFYDIYISLGFIDFVDLDTSLVDDLIGYLLFLVYSFLLLELSLLELLISLLLLISFIFLKTADDAIA